jgi:hypothetical protein
MVLKIISVYKHRHALTLKSKAVRELDFVDDCLIGERGCREFWGMYIGEPNGSGQRSIQGRCKTCGYEIVWTLISCESRSDL